ncbi:MAG: biotin transporter BioY [Albidovulum sp.]|nr:biotin transporter BioY [Albidovulum sp.]
MKTMRKFSERDIALVSLFTAFVAALGLVPTVMLASGVPITAQSLGIMLCGTVLGSIRGFAAAGLFVLLVALGLPLLAGGRGGLGLFVTPSAGFLIGFPFAAFAIGWIVENTKSVGPFWATAGASIAGGVVLLYIPGIFGMAFAIEKSLAEAAVLALPFVPGDILKAVLAGLVTSSLLRMRPESVISRRI